MNSRKMLVFCDGGLGNRLNSLIGGLITADIINADPMISWPANNWCGCQFNELFNSNFSVDDKGINQIFTDTSDDIFLIHENQNNASLKYVYTHSLESIEKIKSINKNVIYYHNKMPKNYTLNQMIEKLELLKINENILNDVVKFCEINNINKDVKGVHIRRTDTGRYIDQDQLYNEVKKSESRFFVCSDDEESEKKFNTLPNVCIFPKTSYVQKLVDGEWRQRTRDTDNRVFKYNVDRPKQSVIEAFVDLLILSRTTMFSKTKSSFSGWAIIYSNIKDLK